MKLLTREKNISKLATQKIGSDKNIGSQFAERGGCSIELSAKRIPVVLTGQTLP